MVRMESDFTTHVRLNANQRSKLLCRLDEAPTPMPPSERRREERWEYRMSDVAVIVQHPGGGSGRFLVCSRNLSAGGMAFIHGGYIHPGSECRVGLTRWDDRPLAVTGVIAHCRHLEGQLHEVGIRFARPINPKTFLGPPDPDEVGVGEPALELPTLTGRILVVDGSAADRRLITHYLSATGAGATAVGTTGAALDAVRRHSFDVVLCEISLEGGDAVRLIKQMRRLGFRGPILLVTAESDVRRLTEAREAGANEIIGKPWNPAYLGSLLAEWLESPASERTIYSSLEEHPGMAELIVDFINEARRAGHQLGKAVTVGDAQRARQLCLRLAGSGSGYGFDELTGAARDAITALETSNNVLEAASSPLRRLMETCQRLGCSRAVTPVRM